jgi:hypothetical protein
VAYKDQRVAQLLNLFKWAENNQGKLKDACQKQRATCYASTKKQA